MGAGVFYRHFRDNLSDILLLDISCQVMELTDDIEHKGTIFCIMSKNARSNHLKMDDNGKGYLLSPIVGFLMCVFCCESHQLHQTVSRQSSR